MKYNIGDPVFLISNNEGIVGNGRIKHYFKNEDRYLISNVIVSYTCSYMYYNNISYPENMLLLNLKLKRKESINMILDGCGF